MKICSIHIKGFKQFQDTYLDFTDPKTGEPASKICFIGRNGTGKTTILKLIFEILSDSKFAARHDKLFEKHIFSVLIKFFIDKRYYYLYFSRTNIKYSGYYHEIFIDHPKVEEYFRIDNIGSRSENLIQYIIPGRDRNNNNYFNTNEYLNSEYKDIIDKIKITLNDLLIYSPSESQTNNLINLSDVPNTSLNEALKHFKTFPNFIEVSESNVSHFWTLLIYLIKKRDEEQQVFENLPDNLSKTKRELLEEFERINPKILDKIAILWNKILDKAGLEFDVESASNPTQLTDNLKAYIRLKGTKENIPYSELSTGIRNFIFRVGHIFSLYFNREVNNGFLLLDEPENSLFPDFLYDLIETYESIVVDKNGNNNTQIFMTTHNPIIAAQFEPHERIILEWKNDGTVSAHKGKTPIGDDPNDILKNDFGLESLMGKKGVQMWNEYLSLKQSLRKENSYEEKLKLIDRITSIGSAYNFE